MAGVDFDCAGHITVPVLFFQWMPSIAAFEERARCGARQWHRGGAPGGAGPYVIGPARPKAATLGNRGPARGARRTPALGSPTGGDPPVAPPGAPFPFWGNGKRGTAGRPGRPNSKPRDALRWPECSWREREPPPGPHGSKTLDACDCDAAGLARDWHEQLPPSDLQAPMRRWRRGNKFCTPTGPR
jgi:hypothetical protein